MKPANVEKTLAGRVYRQIRRDVINGSLPAGSKLRMSALCQQYDVGLSPVREALARLVGDGLVATEGQRGFWVTPLSETDLLDICSVARLLESEALTRSIENGTDDWQSAVSQSFHKLSAIESSLGDRPDESLLLDWEAANNEFHDALVSASGSAWLSSLRKKLGLQLERYRLMALLASQTGRCQHDEHEALFLAATKKQTLKAVRLSELHFDRMIRTIRGVLRSSPAVKSGTGRQPGAAAGD